MEPIHEGAESPPPGSPAEAPCDADVPGVAVAVADNIDIGSATEVAVVAAADSAAARGSSNGSLETLTSGQRRMLRGGSVQAHICVVASTADVEEVMSAFHQAQGFGECVSWSYAYRLLVQGSVGAPTFQEGIEDGLDDGCGEKILSILQRSALHGLLLITSRWQDYGADAGLEIFGTMLYSIVSERCKDLLANLKQAMGLSDGALESRPPRAPVQPPRVRKNFDFGFLPPLPEPRAQMRYGSNHFLSEMPQNKPSSLPNLFSGGDPRMWMESDRCLKELADSEIWELRRMRQPDERIERVLQAVAVLRGQKIARSGAPAARWGQCMQVLRSPTIRTELMLFDAGSVSRDGVHCAAQLLRGLDVEDLRRATPAAAALFEWVSSVIRWRLEGPPPSVAGLHEDMEIHPIQTRDVVPVGLPPPKGGSPVRARVPAKRMAQSASFGALVRI
jgi:hypothetical protein